MVAEKLAPAANETRHEWSLPASVTLDSAVRVKGVERALRTKLAWTFRKQLIVEGNRVILSLPEGGEKALQHICWQIEAELTDLPHLPVLPSEIEDILSISSRERHKWVADGRLQRAGSEP